MQNVKKVVLLSLVAALTLGIAGMSWAADPAPATVEAEAASEPLVTEAPQPEIGLEDLFAQPVEAGACCMADCLDARSECNAACGMDEACRAQCQADYESCRRSC